jgi:hypothetical protein
MAAAFCIQVSALLALKIHLTYKEPGQNERANKYRCRDPHIEEGIGKAGHGLLMAPRPLSVRA